MKNKLIVVDDFLNENFVLGIQNNLKQNNISLTWYKKEDQHIYYEFCQILLKESEKYYDLTSCVGYEFWTQNNTRPQGWHYDKDERLFHSTNILKFPICSLIYYLNIKDLVGGCLQLENITIIPKTNRLVIFSPGIYHCVEEFTGQRTSILLNPWDYNLVSG